MVLLTFTETSKLWDANFYSNAVWCSSHLVINIKPTLDDPLAARPILPVNTITCHLRLLPLYVRLCLSLAGLAQSQNKPFSVICFPLPAQITRPLRSPEVTQSTASRFRLALPLPCVKVTQEAKNSNIVCWWYGYGGAGCVWTCLALAVPVCLSVFQWVIHCVSTDVHTRTHCSRLSDIA